VSDKYVLAIDAGSSGARSLITNIQGQLVSFASQEWTYDTPTDVAPLGKEFDPRRFWDIICRLMGETIKKAAIASRDIIGVSTASQRQGVVFLDKKGHELYAGPNTDLRALSEGFSIDKEFGSEVYRITGRTPSFLFTPAKLRWFRSNLPHIYRRIATVLSISDWVTYKLSGERTAEISSASDTGLVDIHESRWSGRLVEMLGLPQGIYPEISRAGARVGTVTSAAAEQTGLATGTPVVTGGADSQCGLLGMGRKDEGQVGIMAGWSGCVQMVTAQPIIDSGGRIWASCHVLPGKWVLESNAMESGGAYQWLKELIYHGCNTAEDGYTLMDRMAQETVPGAEGVLAFLGPRLMDMSRLRPSQGGFFFSITPSVTRIRMSHLIRAALENLCFAFKANCSQLEEVSGMRVKEVSIGGGLVQSRALVQILSDVLDMPVTCPEMAQVTSWGTAMCAAVGSGAYANLEQALEAMRPKSRILEPTPKSAKEYLQHYQRWLSVGKRIEDLSEERNEHVEL
jgi:sugar (pentulose or hexulose) kinase